MEDIVPLFLNPVPLRSVALAMMVALMAASSAYAKNLGDFNIADANHDGRITLQEFSTYETQRLKASNGFTAQRFKQMTPQEQKARLQARFKELDSGNKGYLDQNDWNGP
jgi:Ca2+-binding EF-hand superfamily protein